MNPSAPQLPPAPPAPARPTPAAAIGFFTVLLALVLFEGLAQLASPVLGLAWSELFTMLLPALVAAAGSNLRVVPYLGLGRPRALPVALGALCGVAGYFAAAGLAGLWISILPRELAERFPDVSRIFRGPVPVQVTITALAAGLAPVCEEAAFRGYFQRTLARASGPGVAIAATGVLFAARHLDPLRFAPLVLLGILFGWLSWRAGSLWPAIAAHAANNGVGAATVLSGLVAPETAQADVSVGGQVTVLLAGAALLAPIALLYRRATPAPPPADACVEPREPALPTTRFLPWLVPTPLQWAVVAGVVTLLALVAFSG
ncbi:MAG TPA: type II CAAX endopeptidase family protein [Anaeromyxobacter sp.]|nr:type II CAAX endopeptidase family protein [Anaeromyxobacter sp.]